MRIKSDLSHANKDQLGMVDDDCATLSLKTGEGAHL